MEHKRVLLKLSGESLSGGNNVGGITPEGLLSVTGEIKEAVKGGAQIAIVIGGGNFWRGATKEMDRVTADYIGMLATVMNALALADALSSKGIPAVALSAFNVSKLAQLYTREKAVAYLNDGSVVILCGGTGNPFFTTDTTAALRALEIEAGILLKATQVDGVYDADPKINPSAKRYNTLTFSEAIEKNLKVMDLAAFSLCRENNLPIMVFDFHKNGNLAKAVAGEKIGTIVNGGLA
jgi:uridylate kinase